MSLKTTFLCVFFALTLVSCSDSPDSAKYIKQHQGKLQIITNTPSITIHTKMITGELADVVDLPNLGVEKMIYQDQKKIDDADIVITQNLPDTFSLNNASQMFHGTHLSMVDNPGNEIVIPLAETIANIETIRDTISEIDPLNRGAYFDQAGNYENLLRNTYKTLQLRINEYNKKPFLIFGDHMGVFLEEFGLAQYIVAIFPHIVVSDTRESTFEQIRNLIRDKEVAIAFVEGETDAGILELLKEEKVITYQVSNIKDDTSAWGYIRFIEKMVDAYVTAFNAYD